jgi:SpoVK/Ycf46/Vps4 family AAA+-type ATPase
MCPALEQYVRDVVGSEASLTRLHRVLYPVFRVEYTYEEPGSLPFTGGSTAKAVTRVDGLWADNHEHLQQYGSNTDSIRTVALSQYDYSQDGAGLGETVLFDFQLTDDRAASLFEQRLADLVESREFADPSAYTNELEDTIRTAFGLPEAVTPERFGSVTSVDRLYLPFWVVEIEQPDERDQIGTLRTPEEIWDGEFPHRWLSSWLREDTSRLARYAHDAIEQSQPDPSDSDSVEPGDRTVDSGTDSTGMTGDSDPATVDSGSGSGSGSDSPDDAAVRREGVEPEPVQPENVDLDAESLVEPSPARCFNDVGGMEQLRETFRQSVIGPVRRPEVYSSYGLDPLSGVILHGPPGCGKTYVAGALAGELEYAFLEVTPSDLTSKYMGKPADNVSDVFDIARANQPCLLFLDEFDAVAGDRENTSQTSQRQLVNQLLTELESLSDEDVLVVAATNRLEDIDEAVLRTGRFDEQIEVPPPDARARWEILRIHLQERPLDSDLELRPIVESTAGYAASDLEYIAETGARQALREQEPIGTEHLRAAMEDVDSSVPDWAGSAIGDGKTVTQPDDVDLNARTLVTPSVERTFEDVGGMDDLLETLGERVIDPLERSEQYEEYDLSVTNGLLLHGPPGCGKTHVASALAGELDYAFLDVSPADLTSKWMGKPAQNVSDLFAIARANQPCLLFLDEIDAIAASRTGSQNASQRQLVNQLLTELEAIADTEVVVVAATNRPEDVDGAIRRAGRFDERIEAPPPTPRLASRSFVSTSTIARSRTTSTGPSSPMAPRATPQAISRYWPTTPPVARCTTTAPSPRPIYSRLWRRHTRASIRGISERPSRQAVTRRQPGTIDQEFRSELKCSSRRRRASGERSFPTEDGESRSLDRFLRRRRTFGESFEFCGESGSRNSLITAPVPIDPSTNPISPPRTGTPAATAPTNVAITSATAHSSVRARPTRRYPMALPTIETGMNRSNAGNAGIRKITVRAASMRSPTKQMNAVSPTRNDQPGSRNALFVVRSV